MSHTLPESAKARGRANPAKERTVALARFTRGTRAREPSRPAKIANVAELFWGGRGRIVQVNLIDIVLIIITMALYLRIWTPWGDSEVGNLVRRVNLPLLGRLRMHGPAAAMVIVAALAGLAVGWVSLNTVIIILALLATLIVTPMTYTLTSQGIRPGKTPFRRWTEFGGVARRRGGVRLQGVAGARARTIWLSGGREDDEFVLLLRQLVRGSYKGHLGPEAGSLSIAVIDSAATPASPIGIAGAS